MADHTTKHWPSQLYLPSVVVDRDNREGWLRAGGKDTYERAQAETDRRLAAYQRVETDPRIVAELELIIRAGLRDQTELPDVPAAPAAAARSAAAGGAGAAGSSGGVRRTADGRRRNPRRERGRGAGGS